MYVWASSPNKARISNPSRCDCEVSFSLGCVSSGALVACSSCQLEGLTLRPRPHHPSVLPSDSVSRPSAISGLRQCLSPLCPRVDQEDPKRKNPSHISQPNPISARSRDVMRSQDHLTCIFVLPLCSHDNVSSCDILPWRGLGAYSLLLDPASPPQLVGSGDLVICPLRYSSESQAVSFISRRFRLMLIVELSPKIGAIVRVRPRGLKV